MGKMPEAQNFLIPPRTLVGQDIKLSEQVIMLCRQDIVLPKRVIKLFGRDIKLS